MESLNVDKLNLSSETSRRSASRTESGLLDMDDDHYGGYAEEIWSNLMEKDAKSPKIQFQSPQLEFRGSLVQYLRNIKKSLNLNIATLHSAVALLDLFMDAHTLRADRLKHVTLACLSLAAKSEERYSQAPSLRTLSSVTGELLCGRTFRQLECKVGEHVRWKLLAPTPVTFAALLARHLVSKNEAPIRLPKHYLRFRNDAAKLLEEYLDLLLSDVRLKVMEKVDMACACVACTRADLGLVAWPAELAALTGRTEANIMPIFHLLQRMMRIKNSRDCPSGTHTETHSAIFNNGKQSVPTSTGTTTTSATYVTSSARNAPLPETSENVPENSRMHRRDVVLTSTKPQNLECMDYQDENKYQHPPSSSCSCVRQKHVVRLDQPPLSVAVKRGSEKVEGESKRFKFTGSHRVI